MKENQAVTTSQNTFWAKSVKEFHQTENEIPLILHGSINQKWAVSLLWNAMTLLIVQ